ncbi:rhomboid family intramembrane serine protease [Butyrivibrio sp. AE3004]|uniref:rhomboid family intramembrane serine protease n=1 Tax=Butyrivibrio sp. AE3004 TaxID=1506994 RepID=UPI0006923EC6|nr:rhomboid family intramembrane serine protease [Butyrivibrio sp. AE3004]
MKDFDNDHGIDKASETTNEDVKKINNEDFTEAFWDKQKNILISSYINTIIIILNIIIFIISLILGEPFVQRFEQRADYIMAGSQYYRLVTSMFLHADAEHLFSNMLILMFVGANVEYDIGHIFYLILYFLSGIGGNILSIAYDFFKAEFIPSIGASGAVFGIIGAVIVIVYYGRKKLKKGSNLMIRLALMVALSVYTGFRTENVDNAAHIGGLLSGIIIVLLITIINKKEYTMEEWL